MSARIVRAAGAGLLAAALAGCAGGGASAPNGELKTASDQSPQEKRASIRLQLAVGYFQDGKLEVALDEVKQAIAIQPDFADAYGVRALIYSQLGQTALADENFQRAIKLAPANPELANNYGSFLCQQGKGAQGIALFESALKNPAYASPVKAMLNAGSCSLKMKNLEAAERYLLDALRYEPDHPATNANLARVYYERRDYTRAGFFINRVKAAAKLDSLSPDVLWLAMRIDRKLGDKASEASLGTMLRRHHPGSPEYAAFQRGAFDE
ncbi:type IV pilus biogenesis/stability protein PilW [Massilia sp. TWR1-2-2]|uniref:type IV pilus biogenesis/stability protein PilW n=1 Tax=Massilia sp. TWR1-2-2 TaxID=2804584 RepID=UPI003CF3BE88